MARKAKNEAEKPVNSIGDNSKRAKIPGLCKVFDEYADIDEQKRKLAKRQRDLRGEAKTKYGVDSKPFNHEIMLRKLDPDVRVQFETNHADLKVALGYQPSLDFENGWPTAQSERAQPPEDSGEYDDEGGEDDEDQSEAA